MRPLVHLRPEAGGAPDAVVSDARRPRKHLGRCSRLTFRGQVSRSDVRHPASGNLFHVDGVSVRD